jgi:hypothetical protein
MSIPEIVFWSALALPAGLGVGIFIACALLELSPAGLIIAFLTARAARASRRDAPTNASRPTVTPAQPER